MAFIKVRLTDNEERIVNTDSIYMITKESRYFEIMLGDYLIRVTEQEMKRIYDRIGIPASEQL